MRKVKIPATLCGIPIMIKSIERVDSFGDILLDGFPDKQYICGVVDGRIMQSDSKGGPWEDTGMRWK